jgi:hypothetical protein
MGKAAKLEAWIVMGKLCQSFVWVVQRKWAGSTWQPFCDWLMSSRPFDELFAALDDYWRPMSSDCKNSMALRFYQI